jgi:hypothetical protein
MGLPAKRAAGLGPHPRRLADPLADPIRRAILALMESGK